MISYYPNAGRLNKAFDKAFHYEPGNSDEERAAQMVYEVCAKVYQAGFCDGVDKMTQNIVKLLKEKGICVS